MYLFLLPEDGVRANLDIVEIHNGPQRVGTISFCLKMEREPASKTQCILFIQTMDTVQDQLSVLVSQEALCSIKLVMDAVQIKYSYDKKNLLVLSVLHFSVFSYVSYIAVEQETEKVSCKQQTYAYLRWVIITSTAYVHLVLYFSLHATKGRIHRICTPVCKGILYETLAVFFITIDVKNNKGKGKGKGKVVPLL
jgi:hypothetical protein